MPESKLMGLTEYSKKYAHTIPPMHKRKNSTEISRQAILYRVNKGLELPFVRKIERVGNQLILTVEES